MTARVTHLYLSRLILDTRARQVRSELAHPYEMHRTLMHAFPNVPAEDAMKAREKFSVLFRADADDRRNAVTVYVQSSVEPDWSFLRARRDYLFADPDHSKDIAEAYQGLHVGRVLRFHLRANPTRRIANAIESGDELQGKRVGLLREEEQVAWLIRKGREREKGKPGGFEVLLKEVRAPNGEITPIPHVNAACEGKQTGLKTGDGQPQEITHLAVRFDGLLRITDADAFRATLAHGIGPAKAFGFGLLSVAPANA
jgi:CRISPR system Cascade subunit CasE